MADPPNNLAAQCLAHSAEQVAIVDLLHGQRRDVADGALGELADGSDWVAGLYAYVKDRLASYSYPKEIGIGKASPMTVSGKVVRKELKAMAMAEMTL